jgi:GTPase SAR1 family protein
MLKLKFPFAMIVSGSSGSGKTVFTQKLLNNWNTIVDQPFNQIVWSLSDVSTPPNLDQNLKIQLINGLPQENPEQFSVLVVDDQMVELEQDKKFANYFTKGHRHQNFCVIYLTQNLFNKGRFTRNITLNAQYFAIFKNPRDSMQFNVLARQLQPTNSKGLINIYKESTKNPHTYLFIDLCQDTDDAFRFRSDIFNPDYTTVFCPKNVLIKENGFTQVNQGQQTYFTCTKKRIT